VCALNNQHLIKYGGVVGGLDIDATVAFGKPRLLPLEDSVRKVLRTYHRWKKDNRYPLDATAPFFTTLYTRKRLVPLDFQRIVRKASAVLGVRLKPHDLRHTFAVSLLRATGDLKAVQRQACPQWFIVDELAGRCGSFVLIIWMNREIRGRRRGWISSGFES
jgi:integrase